MTVAGFTGSGSATSPRDSRWAAETTRPGAVFKDGDFRKIGLVFAFVVHCAGHAGGARGGDIGSDAFLQSPGEVFRVVRVSEAGDGYPGLVIAGAGLQRQESDLP